jgi:hypothetical protein
MRSGSRIVLLGLSLGCALVLGGCFLFENQLPVARFTAAPMEGGTPLYVSFDATGSYDPDGYVSAYSWRFGDGKTAWGPTPTHTYATAGTFSVTLAVTDNNGERSETTEQVVAHQGASYAIVVGIATYMDLPALSFTDDDAQSVAAWLRQTGGWDPSNVTLLVNGNATAANLAAAVNALDDASAWDTLFFFFSGHGTKTGDDDAFEEADLQDECLCLYDQTYFRDDTLQALLSQVPMSRIVVMIDACYSGGQLNSLGAHPDAEPGDFLDDLARLAEPRTRDLDQLVKSIVAVAACRYDEYSWELNALGHGAFTYALLEALDGLADAQGNGDGMTSAEECYAYIAPRAQELVWSAGWKTQSAQLLDLCPGQLGFAAAP